MRTTVDIPEGLLRRARARAALDGTRMKDVVNQALRAYLKLGEEARVSEKELPEPIGIEHFGRFRIPVIRSPRPGNAAVTPEMLKEAEAEEDQDRHASTFGR